MELTVENINENMESWRRKPYLSQQARELLVNLDVIIVPEEEFREYGISVFPSNLLKED